MEDRREDELSFGVFKPVGHVVIAFARAEDAAAAARAFGDLDLEGGSGAVRSFDDRQMMEQIDRDIERASSIAALACTRGLDAQTPTGLEGDGRADPEGEPDSSRPQHRR